MSKEFPSAFSSPEPPLPPTKAPALSCQFILCTRKGVVLGRRGSEPRVKRFFLTYQIVGCCLRRGGGSADYAPLSPPPIRKQISALPPSGRGWGGCGGFDSALWRLLRRVKRFFLYRYAMFVFRFVSLPVVPRPLPPLMPWANARTWQSGKAARQPDGLLSPASQKRQL